MTVLDSVRLNECCTLKEAELIPDSAVPKPLGSRCKSETGAGHKPSNQINGAELRFSRQDREECQEEVPGKRVRERETPQTRVSLCL